MHDECHDPPDGPCQERTDPGDHSANKKRVYRLAAAIDIERVDESEARAAGEQGSAKDRQRNGNKAGFSGRCRRMTDSPEAWRQFAHEVSSDCETAAAAEEAGVISACNQRRRSGE